MGSPQQTLVMSTQAILAYHTWPHTIQCLLHPCALVTNASSHSRLREIQIFVLNERCKFLTSLNEPKISTIHKYIGVVTCIPLCFVEGSHLNHG